MSVRLCANGFHTTTDGSSALTALDSTDSAPPRAARPSSQASRQPVSRSRYTWSDSLPVMASWWAPQANCTQALASAASGYRAPLSNAANVANRSAPRTASSAARLACLVSM